ncbi:MAG: phosphonate metabolism protein/1,5-bisphosphokinase (PRPP-forming) PhnN [Rhodocyclaceae bacterium]|nr:phosphonate metabolism protein/1,5-bisphosphokinase (PRPP-forming) PhnN [Rhodocyclaceae bacterium]
MESPRFAIYFSPPAHAEIAKLADAWLGRAPAPPALADTLRSANILADSLHALTQHPRRYGFHATLKAPFHLSSASRVEQLLARVEQFAKTQASFLLPPLKVAGLKDFLALVPGETSHSLNTMASRCVTEFEVYRQPLTSRQIAQRRQQNLSPRQDALLLQWGYPHVFDCYEFHLTLTDSLSSVNAGFSSRIRAAAEQLFSDKLTSQVTFDAISVFEEPQPGADFRLILRAPLGRQGRLIYLVGPSGAGKDSLLRWTRQKLGYRHDLLFAQRVITRERREDDEEHEPMSEQAFTELEQQGGLAMAWQANSHRYGVRREIDDALQRGMTVLVNGSRAHLALARERYPHLEAVHVTAPEAIIEQRLHARGRESAEQIVARQARQIPMNNDAPFDLEIANTGTLEAAGTQLMKFLRGAAGTELAAAQPPTLTAPV